MTPGEIAAVIGGCVSLASLGGIIFAAGAFYADVKALRTEISALQTMAKEWGTVLYRLGNVESVQARNTSDIRELNHAEAEVRAELASIHDEG
jgi:hypothetical protein